MSFKKRLPRSTIIPTSLYVERAADRQLKSIVEDMGRPGYVLVARQMGKTNLLIHMKRTRVHDLVLYKDLSSQFETPRAFFRDIIDSLLESFPELATDSSYSKIEDLDVEANVEYDRNLRRLLKCTSKKIIIVLDEIDSLVNSSFSDVIFAQIRSMYFSRINFPEYERLTYVLSGVAEPTDLIKNKNISPFNIGEKIYLEDFDISEFGSFITNSGLEFSKDVVDRIYSWTAGNPRTTWDICSELEDLAAANGSIDVSTVDKTIDKLYLHDFDRAPIDHIRTLVESDKVIRDAISSIRWGKSSYVDDKTKSRLYLAGIIRSAGGEAAIKNRIIDDALSDSWINSITPAATSPVIVALSLYEVGDYASAAAEFEKIKADISLDSRLTPAQRLKLASAYLWIKNVDQALVDFESTLNMTTSAANRQDAELRIGNSLSYFSEHAHATKFFKAASEGPSIILKFNAQLNLAETYRFSGLENNEKTLEIIENLLEKLKAPENLASEAGRNLYVAASVCRAQILMEMSSFEAADIAMQEAFPVATYSSQAKILLTRYDCIRDPLERQDILVQICSIIMNNRLTTTSLGGTNLHLDNKQIIQIMVKLCEQECTALLNDFIEYVHLSIFNGASSLAETVLSLFYSIPARSDRAGNINILEYFASSMSEDTAPAAARLNIYRELSTNTPQPQSMMWRIRYLDELEKHSDTLLSLEDIQYLSITAYHLRKRRDQDQLHRLYAFWEKNKEKAAAISVFWSVFVMAHGMIYLHENKELKRAKEYALATLALMEINEKELFSSSSSIELLRIRDQAESLLRIIIEPDPYRAYGRNQRIKVRYGSSDPVDVKFKHAKDDLVAGRCTIIPE